MIDVFAARSSHATAGLSQCDRARQRLFMVRLRTRLALSSISDELTIGFSYEAVPKIKLVLLGQWLIPHPISACQYSLPTPVCPPLGPLFIAQMIFLSQLTYINDFGGLW